MKRNWEVVLGVEEAVRRGNFFLLMKWMRGIKRPNKANKGRDAISEDVGLEPAGEHI